MQITQITQDIQKAVFEANKMAVQTIRSKIKEENNVNGLLEQIQHLPSDIYNHRIKINQYRSQQRTLFREMKDRETILKSLENDLLLMITAETNPETGKPKFSNEKARQAELANRKKTDQTYQDTEAQIKKMKDHAEQLENEVAMAEAELDKLENQFYAIRKQLDLATKEIALAAAAMSSAALMPQQNGIKVPAPGFNESSPSAEGWDD